ncbi:MAG: hypothetical protein GF330_02295 [Candidatus Eisenbacteria bacterium]|nr:hypothetical protein [Candidatus Eisenbacteria bacterium]
MKRVLLAVALIGLGAGIAGADENDLTGGVFICHHDPDIVYSEPLEGWCQHYLDGYAITTCEEQNPQIMTTDERVWFVLSAFSADKVWCGTEFGFGQYEPYLFVFTSWGPCAPGGNLEIPSDNWPGPNEGTAIVTTDSPWSGNFEPVYYFTGYTYYYPGQIPFDVDPPTGFGGWGNCQTPPADFDAACFPAMGVMTEGVSCCPTVPEFVCCVGEDCVLTTEQECADMQGEWHPEWDSCDPNPCVERHVCCVGEECYITTEADCTELQGVYHPEWDSCDPNPCELPRAVCCLEGDCYITTEQGCMDMQGEWHPEWDSCDPNPCPPTDADRTTWGSIKSIYRR